MDYSSVEEGIVDVSQILTGADEEDSGRMDEEAQSAATEGEGMSDPLETFLLWLPWLILVFAVACVGVAWMWR